MLYVHSDEYQTIYYNILWKKAVKLFMQLYENYFN